MHRLDITSSRIFHSPKRHLAIAGLPLLASARVLVAVGALGMFAPGCASAPAKDGEDVATSAAEIASGALCASPVNGGEYCVPSNEDPARAWHQAVARGGMPVQMWVKLPTGTTLDQLVASRDAIRTWFAQNDRVIAFVRDKTMSAESYRATLAGHMGALIKQARDRQAQLLAEKPDDPVEHFKAGLTDKANVEKSPIVADLAKEKQAQIGLQSELDKAIAAIAPLSEAYAHVVTEYEAYRATESAEGATFVTLAETASQSTLDTIDAAEQSIVAAARDAGAKPNDLRVDAAKAAGELDAFEVELRRRLASYTAFTRDHGITAPDMTSSALRSLAAMLTYVQLRTAHSEATANSVLEDLAARRKALELRDTAHLSALALRLSISHLAGLTATSVKLKLPYLADRYDQLSALAQLEPVCEAPSPDAEDTGCAELLPQMTSARSELTRIPAAIREGLATMRRSGVDARAIATVEAWLSAGDAKAAALAYDATVRGTDDRDDEDELAPEFTDSVLNMDVGHGSAPSDAQMRDREHRTGRTDATPYEIRWWHEERPGSCESAGLTMEGQSNFDANGTPLPTYTIPGSEVGARDGSSRIEAESRFDSLLLRPNFNSFGFEVTVASGDNRCVNSYERVQLRSRALGHPITLFVGNRVGTHFAGRTLVKLGLAEVNPPLARDLAKLEAAVASEREALVENAAKVGNLATRLSALQLDADLESLLDQPLEDIEPSYVDEIRARHSDVFDEATLAAVDQLLEDLRKSIADLKGELGHIAETFGQQADAVAGRATEAARAAGWNPDDLSQYEVPTFDAPVVELPNMSGKYRAFAPENDPYAAYADKVVEALEADVVEGKVVARADFLAQVQAWHANQDALRKAQRQRADVSQAEMNAFLTAQNRVTADVRKYLDASDWFLDTKVPLHLRAAIDGELTRRFGKLASELKETLSLNAPPTADADPLFQTIDAFAAGISAISDDVTPYFALMKELTELAASVGVAALLPEVAPAWVAETATHAGAAFQLCRAVTGNPWCVPTGESLSDEERLASGIGAALPYVGKFWGGVKAAGALKAGTAKAAVSIGGFKLADDVAQLDPKLVEILEAYPMKPFTVPGGSTTLGHAALQTAVTATRMSKLDIEAVRVLTGCGDTMVAIGNNAVRSVFLPARFSGSAVDFISVVPKSSKLAITKVVERNNKVAVENAVAGIQNVFDELNRRGLADYVQELRLVVPQGWSGPYTVHGGQLVYGEGKLFVLRNNGTTAIAALPISVIEIARR